MTVEEHVRAQWTWKGPCFPCYVAVVPRKDVNIGPSRSVLLGVDDLMICASLADKEVSLCLLLLLHYRITSAFRSLEDDRGR